MELVSTFSLAAANHEGACPCATGSPDKCEVGVSYAAVVPAFVGSDFYCESGNPTIAKWTPIVYTDDVLWDGKQCGGSEEPCCTPDPEFIPYF